MRVVVKTSAGEVRELDLEEGARAKEAVLAAGENPETVLITKAGAAGRAALLVVPDIEPLKEGDRLELLKVVSGG